MDMDDFASLLQQVPPGVDVFDFLDDTFVELVSSFRPIFGNDLPPFNAIDDE